MQCQSHHVFMILIEARNRSAKKLQAVVDELNTLNPGRKQPGNTRNPGVDICGANSYIRH